MRQNHTGKHQMAVQTKLTLLEELQLQFPSLDGSLIAASFSERGSETLTKRQLRNLRRFLTELATGADHDEQFINQALSSTHIDDSAPSSSALSRIDDTSSAPSTATDATSPLASPRSLSSTASFSSPLGFLQAAFPDVPPSRLECVITDVSCDGGLVDEVDVERAVQLLLAEEYPRDDDSVLSVLDGAPRAERQVVNARRKKRKDKPKIVIVNDVRQQGRVSSESRHGSPSTISQRSLDVDIWTSISSISAYLAALLPPRSESFFKSFFHSPESKAPAAAVRRALSTITFTRDGNDPPLDMTTLLNLQDILRSTLEYNEISVEERKRLLSDARLCLHAVGSRPDNALDLVWLLRSLDADDAAGWNIAPCHREPLPHQNREMFEKTPPSPTSTTHTGLRSGRPPGRPPSQPQNNWNVVHNRKQSSAANRHGVASSDSNGMSPHEIGFAVDKDSTRLKQRRDDIEACLREASLLAARAWKGGNSKNMRRQIAMYHVEEVRRLQGEFKDAALDVARARVNASKKTTASVTTIDLHYTTAAQAVILARELLRDYGVSGSYSVRFITGRGNHSVGGKAVLGPAVYDALVEDGWNVSSFPAGLIVHGRLHD